MSTDGVQLPPTQGHDIDMGTPQNTAAIYVRRSAVDSANTEADAFSRSLAAQERGACGTPLRARNQSLSRPSADPGLERL